MSLSRWLSSVWRPRAQWLPEALFIIHHSQPTKDGKDFVKQDLMMRKAGQKCFLKPKQLLLLWCKHAILSQQGFLFASRLIIIMSYGNFLTPRAHPTTVIVIVCGCLFVRMLCGFVIKDSIVCISIVLLYVQIVALSFRNGFNKSHIFRYYESHIFNSFKDVLSLA